MGVDSPFGYNITLGKSVTLSLFNRFLSDDFTSPVANRPLYSVDKAFQSAGVAAFE